MQARAPDEGPSGVRPSASESGNELTSRNVETEERYGRILLRTVVKKHNIDSTKSLVAAYNATTDEAERAVLVGWLRNYHERSEDCLAPEAVLEYAELANVVPRSTSEANILKKLIRDLCSSISEGEFLKPKFAAAIHRALVCINPSVYDGAKQLVVVARKLLGSLSATPNLDRENFSEHKWTFLTLQQTLFLLNAVNQNKIRKEEKQALSRTIAEKERTMKLSCKLYSVDLHFQVLRHEVERLKEDASSQVACEDTSTRDAQTRQHVLDGLRGFVRVFHSFRNRARGDIDPTVHEDSSERNQVSVVEMSKMSKRPWFDSLWDLMAARLKATKDEINLVAFESAYSSTIANQQKIENGEELKALRFGIIDELGMLAIEGSSERTRREATIMLSDLATQQAVGEGWIDDDDILMALLDVIYDVHRYTGQGNETTREALEALHQSCEGSTRDALMEWLDGNSLEDKLRAGSLQGIVPEHEELLTKIGRDVGYIPLAVMNAHQEELRQRYLHSDFATVSQREAHPSR